MDFTSTQAFTSSVDPSVTFTIQKMTRGRRIKFNLQIAPLLEKERMLGAEASDVDALTDPYRLEAKKAACSCSHASEQHDPDSGACLAQDCRCKWPTIPSELRAKTADVIGRIKNLEQMEFEPALIRWALVSIEGLVIDGAPATAETLVESGPEDVVSEIVAEIRKLIGLSPEERKNSELPTTSGALADGQTSNSSAPLVADAVMT